jgi:hypothetical protein
VETTLDRANALLRRLRLAHGGAQAEDLPLAQRLDSRLPPHAIHIEAPLVRMVSQGREPNGGSTVSGIDA